MIDGRQFEFGTPVKKAEPQSGSGRGGGVWKKEPVRTAEEGVGKASPVCAAGKDLSAFLQILCLCELTAEALCGLRAIECMCCFFPTMGLGELLTARTRNGLLKRFCSRRACLWFCGMCGWLFAKRAVSGSSSLGKFSGQLTD